MKKASSVFHYALLLTLASVIMRAVQLFFQIYLSSEIGASGIGLFQLIMSAYTLAFTLGSSGVRISSTVLMAEEMGTKNYSGVRRAAFCCMAYALILGTLAGFALFSAADFISLRFISDPRAALSLKILAVCLPFATLTAVLSGYFTACGKLGRYCAVDLAERILCVLLTIALIKSFGQNDLEYSCAAVVAGSGIMTVLSFLVLLGLFAADISKLPRSGKKEPMLPRMLKLTLPLAFNDYLRSGLSTVENMLIPHGLRRYGDSGEKAMSSYGVICGMVFPVIMFPSAVLYSLADLLLPELAESRAAGDIPRIRRIVGRVLQMGFMYATAVAGVLFFLSDPLGRLLYDSAEASFYIRAFAPLTLMLYLDALVDAMLKGLGEQVASARYNSITAFMDVVLLFIMLPVFGVGGFYAVFFISHAVNFWLSIRRLLKVSGCLPDLRAMASAATSMALAILAARLLFTSGFTAADSLAAGAFLLCFYFLLLILSSSLSPSDLSWLAGLFKKAKR